MAVLARGMGAQVVRDVRSGMSWRRARTHLPREGSTSKSQDIESFKYRDEERNARLMRDSVRRCRFAIWEIEEVQLAHCEDGVAKR